MGDKPEAIETNIEFYGSNDLTAAFESEWCGLFVRCYKCSPQKAHSIFRKYKLNLSRFALLRIEGKLVACYSGLSLGSGMGPVFLATDTMSDGTQKKASVLLGTSLYELLAEAGVVAVVGYPNENICRLREKYLGWEIKGGMHMFVGIPLFWRIGFARTRERAKGLWRVSRPENGFFGEPRPFIRLAARGRTYGSGSALILTLSSNRPSPFFVRVPSWILAPKQFGFRLLQHGNESRTAMLSCLPLLDLDTIDVP